jgi:hypothetical protein
VRHELPRCLGCGGQLGHASGSHRRYCSAACRQRAYRQRKGGSAPPVPARAAPRSSTWLRIVTACTRSEQLVAAQQVQLGRTAERLGALQKLAESRSHATTAVACSAIEPLR